MPKTPDHEETESLTFEQWQQRCAEFLDEELNIDDLLDEDDPHDVFDEMEEAYEYGQSPEDFVREAFASHFDEDDDDDEGPLDEEDDDDDEDDDEDEEDDDDE